MLLAATGGASFVAVMLPALCLIRFRFLQKVYAALLFPVSIVIQTAQIIMYCEFGTEIEARILGLFQGNLPALWTFACAKYQIHWAILATLIASIALGFWVNSQNTRCWRPTLWPCIIIASLMLVSGTIVLALNPSVKDADHFHPVKVSTTPLYQTVAFARQVSSGAQQTGYHRILSRDGEVHHEEAYAEICDRLGCTPDQFATQQVSRPSWIKKQPSHIFCFILESFEYDLVSHPDLEAVAPYLNRFHDEGISVPYFSAPTGATIDSIHTTMTGSAAQFRYPVPRALERFKLDTLPRVMERADYTPIFFAASRRQFGNKGDACEAYGFKHFYGCPDVAPDIPSNEWGVNDGDFFNWTRSQLEDLRSPHFVTFLNVSNHAPYDAPIEELGANRSTSSDVLEFFVGSTPEEKSYYADHVLYADEKMGEMAEWLRAQYPDSLFVFFGDHTGLRLKTNYEFRVPFILWNDEVIDSSVDFSKWYGSHMDILSSLAQLVLPEKSTYCTLGEPFWELSSSRVTCLGDRTLFYQGEFHRNGQVAGLIPGTSKPDQPLPDVLHEKRLKASAISALSWGYLNGEYLSSDLLAAHSNESGDD